MIFHFQLGRRGFERSRKLKTMMDHGDLLFAGNRKLKIYGLLSCKSGKRMKIENRVFFASEEEAVSHGYHPCGHCLKQAYQSWKRDFIK